MSSEKIGEGAFGQVVADGEDEVRKIYDDLSAMLQEAVALRYMSGSEYIVNIAAFNTKIPSISLERWSCSLRDAMKRYKLTYKQKMNIFKCILQGLSHVHQAGMLHSDFKLSNILVDTTTFNACICDLGLSSKTKYAKIGNTAPKHQPKTLVYDQGHDMFGLCVSIVDLFSYGEINKVCSAAQIREIIRGMTGIEEKLRSILIRMCPDDPRKAITVDEVLMTLFKTRTVFKLPTLVTYTDIREGRFYTWLKSTVTTVAKGYEINRDIRCYEALVNFFNSPHGATVSQDYVKIYVAAGLLIYAALFGTYKFNKDNALSCTGGRYSSKDLNTALTVLLMDIDFINITMA